jgi:tRNA pseudouridine38-40 synthase
MTARTVQLVLHYDGSAFAGWQRQPNERTVQGELERVLTRLTGGHVAALGAGRTDAGVHARGQSVGVRVPERWSAANLRRALNALVPRDIWVAAAHEMRPEFHARFSALARRYSYHLGTDEEARSPFRRHTEWPYSRQIDHTLLERETSRIVGDHCFVAFAVRGTASATDDHRCVVRSASWREAGGKLVFDIEANRFLHHMVRFIVGTLVEVASARRDADAISQLLVAPCNDAVSPPAPAHALFLESVTYPSDLYLQSE